MAPRELRSRRGRPSPTRLRPPLLGRLLLRLRRLGGHREEIESDFRELFQERTDERGRWYAALRYCLDAASLWIRRRASVTRSPEFPHRMTVSTLRNRGADALHRGLFLDVLFAVRMFRQRPRVVSVTIAGLALAISVSTVIAGLVQAILLRPIGIPDPSAVVEVNRLYANGRSGLRMWHADYAQPSDAVGSVKLEALGSEDTPFGEINPEETRVARVSGGFFGTMGVDAALGRVLVEEDDTPTAALAVVVTHAFWERRLGGDESIVGQTVRLKGTPFTVVGVLEKGFNGFPRRSTPAFWVSTAIHDRVWRREPPMDLSVVPLGRIVDGVTRQRAEAEIAAAYIGLMSDSGGGEAEIVGARLQAVNDRFSRQDAPALRWALGTIAAILGLILVLASANVANLLLANAMSRNREIGVRLTLGASRARIVRQLLTESLLLGALSGGLGLLFAFWLLSSADRFLVIPWTNPVTLDFRVFGFAVALTLLAGLGAGLAPARYGARGDLAAPLKGDAAPGFRSSKSGRARSVLSGVQAAVSIVLLILSALLIRGVVHATQYDLGFDAERLVSVTPSLGDAGYDVARAAEYWEKVFERVAELPGVERVALVDHVPFAGSYGRVERLDHNGRQSSVYFKHTSSEYFATAGIPVLQGRTYTPEEVTIGAPVAVINAGLARKLRGGGEALGTTLGLLAEDLSETRIIGIVGNAPHRLVDLDSDEVYRPVIRDDGYGSVLRADLLVRATDDVEMILRPVHEAIRAIDPEAVPRTTLARDWVEDRYQALRLNVTMAGFLGTIALGLACIGIFSLTAFSVEQRKGEIGVRLAVGASVSDVVRLMLWDGLRPVVVGLVVGLLGAIAGSQVLTAALYGVSPHDPLAILGAVASLLAATALAAGMASQRAARVDAAIVLRQD